MNKKYEILTLSLFSNKFLINLIVSIEKLEKNLFLLKNDKMDYELEVEGSDISKIKEIFASEVISIFEYAYKENRIFNWLEIWGFEMKDDQIDSYKSAVFQVNETKLKNENNYVIGKDDIFISNISSKYNWEH